MKEEKDEDVVERLAREFLNGVGEEEVKSQESGVWSQESENSKEPSAFSLQPSEDKGQKITRSLEEEMRSQKSEEEHPLPTFEVQLPEKEPPFPIFEESEKKEVTETPEYSPSYKEEVTETPAYSPSYEREDQLKPERPSDEKIKEILTKLDEEEREIGLPKEPVKVEEEEEEEFAEIPEVSDEEILVKRPKSRKAGPKFIKFAILGCIFGGIIAGSFYFGKSYYEPLINLINLNIVNKISKPSCDLMVSSNPVGCDLFVDDIVKGKTPITIKKLTSGDHNLRIEKEGFKPFISVVSVVSKKPINIMANLEPEIKIEGGEVIPVVVGTGTLIVRTNPKSAAVYINGQMAKMPYTLLSGTHSIRVLNDGFFKWTKVIEIKPNETKEIFVQLMPCLGSIFIDSTPRGGSVLFNGEIKGKTPIILSGISPWKPFRITIRSKGYFDWNSTTFVEPNQRTKIMASLKESGIRSREEAKFVPKESFYETRKESGGFVPVLPTRKEDKITETSASILELKRAIDMFKEQVKIEVPVIPPHPEEPFLKRDIPKIIKEKPKPQITEGTGYCFITSVPAGAEVFLNGRLIGKTPIREFTISAGKHRLKAILPGDKEEEKEIIVSSETMNFFNFSLSK